MTVPLPTHSLILAINGGSSSLRFALFTDTESPAIVVRGQLARIGEPSMSFTYSDAFGDAHHEAVDPGSGHAGAIEVLLAWIRRQPWRGRIAGIGHRVVHGMQHAKPELISAALVAELTQFTPFDPQHMPGQLALIAAFGREFPQLRQLACFDTAFHRGMPQVAKLLAIPRRYQAAGVERYGFHGLSYEYCLGELRRIGDRAATQGRVVLVHLGNGASLAAVLDGRSVDTSMGFTANAGLVMSTRSGDLDPGLAFYLAQTENMTPARFHHMISSESGLLGISETSSDVRDLLRDEATDSRAAEALAVFTYQVSKWIGAFAAALGGIDTLVFAGGIGENSAPIRARICAQLGFLGIALHAECNADNAALISRASARTTVRIIRTDEELVIARALQQQLRKS